MKKIIIVLICCMTCTTLLHAQKKKVAIFDPIGNAIDEGRKIVVQDLVAEAILLGGGQYTVVDRTSINKIMEEHKFQATGLVEEAQFNELGKIAGADIVCVTTIVSVENNYYVSLKLIDIATARIEKQQTGQVIKTDAHLNTMVQDLVKKMIAKK